MKRKSRPGGYTEALASQICERIANGQSIRQLCREDGMPAMSSVFKWIGEYPAFAEQYARAKELQIEALAEEILDIADDGSNDWYDREVGDDGHTVRVVDHENIARSRLRVDSRKWLLSKLAPKKYGDRVALAGDAENPIQQRVKIEFVDGPIK